MAGVGSKVFVNTQPVTMQHLGSKVIVTQPVTMHQVGIVESDWTQNLCHCYEDYSTCCSVWCWPCQTYSTGAAMGQNGCLWCMASCINPCLSTFALRQLVRERFNIKGSMSGDYCYSCFCTPCVMCQTAREVRERK